MVKAGAVAGTLFIEFVAGLYLVLYDAYLKSYAIYHWYGMVAYTVINIVLAVAVLASGKRRKGIYSGIRGWAGLGAILMFLDAVLALPFSQFSSTTGVSMNDITSYTGFKYLFGFGYVSGSVLYTSVAFTILFVFSIITAGISGRPK
ncbi:MAG: hypothetical protein M1162_02475 [Candidatus Thermoplasmatota archaeon]|nr:hypothetical protein [Candidatus Thermoplasmatota archaeon]